MCDGLADDEFLHFAECVVGETDEVGSFGEVAEVDDLCVPGRNVLVIDGASAHVDEGAVDYAGNAVDVQADLCGGRVGLEAYVDVRINGVNAI